LSVREEGSGKAERRSGVLGHTFGTMRIQGRSTLALLLSLLVSCVASRTVQAQEPGEPEVCPDGIVSEISIRTLNIFEGEEQGPEGFMSRVYRSVEKIHVTTKEWVVRADLLLEEGDCFDEFLLQESLRTLRNQIYLSSAEARVQRLPDGNVRLEIVTQDDWSLKVSLGISVDEGFTMEGLAASEVNFLGRGATVGILRTEDRELLEYGLTAASPRLFGSAWDGAIDGGTTRTGWWVDEMVRLPFRTEQDRWALRERFHIRSDIFAFSNPESTEYSHLIQDFDLIEADLGLGYRSGRPGRFWVFSGGLTWEWWDFPTGEKRGVQQVRDANFDDFFPASPEDVDLIDGAVSPFSSLRLNSEIGFRSLRYVERPSLDAVKAVQDVRVGPEILLNLGRSLGSVGEHPRDNWYVRGRVGFGWERGPFVGGLRFLWEGRYEIDREEESFRDVLTEGDVYLYLQPSERHTFFGRFSSASGARNDRPFQLTLGGRDGVRGYSRDAFPGAERLLFTVEDRIQMDWPDAPWGDIGFVIFADAGRMNEGTVPFGTTTDWMASVGAGLRLAFPGGSPRVTRIEFSYPLTGDRDQAVYFRFYADVLGLLRGFDDDQLARSRWGGFPLGALER
jgi:hypothetical protein